MYSASSYVICTDTGVDMSWRVAQRQQIEVLHMQYLLDGTAYRYDLGRETDLRAFYASVRQGSRVSTLPVSVDQFCAQWTPILERGADILYLGVASTLSKTLRNAQDARVRMLTRYIDRRIVLVDTQCCSVGQSMLAFEAAHMRLEGAPLDDVARWAVENRAFVHTLLLPETYSALRSAGLYAGGAAAIIKGRHALLRMDADGHLATISRGKTRDEALIQMAEVFAQRAYQPEQQTPAIAHADAPELATQLQDILSGNTGCTCAAMVEIGPITGCYAGPGAIGLAFFGHEPR